jgi:hypothetical protein
MSNIQYAFIESRHVPDRLSLQVGIDALGFDLKIGDAYIPFKDCDFVPVVLNGQAGHGLDLQFLAAEELATSTELRDVVAGRDQCISMAWHGSFKDLACVMIVSCALAKDFGAVVSYAGEPPESLADLLEAAREALEEAANEEMPPDGSLLAAGSRKKTPWWKVW